MKRRAYMQLSRRYRSMAIFELGRQRGEEKTLGRKVPGCGETLGSGMHQRAFENPGNDLSFRPERSAERMVVQFSHSLDFHLARLYSLTAKLTN